MNMSATKVDPMVLIIDDEPQIRRLLRVTLEGHGYGVCDADSGSDGLVQAAERRPGAVLLDLGLQDMDGMSVLRRLREWSRVPVIVLTVRDREDDKIAALDAGADDYITKPFSTGELLARLRAALRHAEGPGPEARFRVGNVEVDLAARVVRKRGREVKLTPIEYDLLRILGTHAGKVVTHRQLLMEVWGPRAGDQTPHLRVHIAHLRSKIEDDPAEPRLVITEPAIGYRLVDPV
jgi:two-component system KDP operon response regulator KdpE